MKHRKKQNGYIDITMIAALAVMSMLAVVQAGQYLQDQKNQLAETAGNTAAQVVNAIRSKVAVDNVAIATGTFTGTGWLKDAGCATGTGSQAHLFCSFGDRLPFGMSYSTVVTNVGGVVTATLSLGAPVTSEGVTPYLADHISTVMNGAGNTFWTPSNQTYFQSSVAAGSVVEAVVSNAPANQEFIARDGTSGPTADHDWSGFDITNIDTLEADELVIDGNTIDGAEASFLVALRALNCGPTQYVTFQAGALACVTLPSVPANTVVGFHGSSCPTGFAAYTQAGGRFLVGAGCASGSCYNWGNTGGDDMVALTEAQMPSHSHGFNYQTRSAYSAATGGAGIHVGAWNSTQSGRITATGGNQAHENRPPYYAVTWCRKT